VAVACSAANVAFKVCYAAGQSACAAGGYVATVGTFVYGYSKCQKAAAAACCASNLAFAPCYAAAQAACAAGVSAAKYVSPAAAAVAASMGLRAARVVLAA